LYYLAAYFLYIGLSRYPLPVGTVDQYHLDVAELLSDAPEVSRRVKLLLRDYHVDASQGRHYCHPLPESTDGLLLIGFDCVIRQNAADMKVTQLVGALKQPEVPVMEKIRGDRSIYDRFGLLLLNADYVAFSDT